ncbi:MAG TPA: ATP-dependent Clp protease ATP-binding subunit [Spirochaetota bacterium]|nr:ATP-dependent Clp protease ATP-binding subunit [Spirochaetota bacterium]
MFEFTKKSRKIIEISAQIEGKRLNSGILGPEHIMISLLKDDDSVAARIMKNLGINSEKILFFLEKNIKNNSTPAPQEVIPASQSFKNIIEFSREEAKNLKNSYIGTEHLLLAVFKEGSCPGIPELKKNGITYETIKDEILRVLGVKSNPRNIAVKNDSKPANLDDFSTDLTALAAKGELDPVIGRDIEISRVIRILSRKRKNNPILIGEAGVGKTAIVEGLAQRIVKQDVPESLYGYRLLALDLSSIVAGTKYRGEFEERLKKLVNEIKNSENLVIFIDEIHTITGAGAAEGAIDAANILKPALARGELQCIGATTMNEYKLYIEKDSALVRRFQNIIIDEPDSDETMNILRGLKETYEKYHKVIYSEESLEEAVILAERYITERYFPDKAIDLIDEAGAMARYDNIDKPAEIIELETGIKRLNENKVELVQAQEYEQAARIRDIISEKKDKLESLSEEWLNRTNRFEVLVKPSLIAKVVAEMTGIPIEELEEDESEKLLNMEEYLNKRVFGQKDAIETVSRAIRRSRVGLGRDDRPNGSFIFLGPTGVGKTELARALAEFLFGEDRNLVRLDMSEFMEKHSVSRLIGSPPGYVGYEEGGQLTEKVRRKPYSVVLFDEIEKAHPDIFNILLQVLDEGELTDSSGTTVSFRDTILIMTSNVGNSESDTTGSLGFGKNESLDYNREKIETGLKKIFSPELLNRIDEIVYFNKLDINDLSSIADLMLKEVADKMSQNDIELVVPKNVRKHLVRMGFDPRTGARNLRRIIQREIEDKIAEKILKDKTEDKIEIRAGLKNGSIYFRTHFPEADKKRDMAEADSTLKT